MPSGTFSVGVRDDAEHDARSRSRRSGRPGDADARAAAPASGRGRTPRSARPGSAPRATPAVGAAGEHAHDLVGIDEPAPARLDHLALVGGGAARAVPCAARASASSMRLPVEVGDHDLERCAAAAPGGSRSSSAGARPPSRGRGGASRARGVAPSARRASRVEEDRGRRRTSDDAVPLQPALADRAAPRVVRSAARGLVEGALEGGDVQRAASRPSSGERPRTSASTNRRSSPGSVRAAAVEAVEVVGRRQALERRICARRARSMRARRLGMDAVQRRRSASQPLGAVLEGAVRGRGRRARRATVTRQRRAGRSPSAARAPRARASSLGGRRPGRTARARDPARRCGARRRAPTRAQPRRRARARCGARRRRARSRRRRSRGASTRHGAAHASTTCASGASARTGGAGGPRARSRAGADRRGSSQRADAVEDAARRVGEVQQHVGRRRASGSRLRRGQPGLELARSCARPARSSRGPLEDRVVRLERGVGDARRGTRPRSAAMRVERVARARASSPRSMPGSRERVDAAQQRAARADGAARGTCCEANRRSTARSSASLGARGRRCRSARARRAAVARKASAMPAPPRAHAAHEVAQPRVVRRPEFAARPTRAACG